MKKTISRRETMLYLGGAAACFSTTTLGSAQSPFTITGTAVDLVLTALSEQMLRLTVLPANSVPDARNEDPVLALASQGRQLLKAAPSAERELAWGRRKLKVSSPLTIAIEESSGQPVQTFRIDDHGAVTFASARDRVFGLGEGGPQFDRRGQQYTMRNGQFSPSLATIGARQPVPWLIASEGWAIFFHKPYGVIDLKGSEYRFEQPAVAVDDPLPLDLFFVASQEPAEIMKAYAQITGFPHMPPLWSLGYQQSHRTLTSREEILDEAKKFRNDKLPCDTMIYLGTGFCPSGWNTGHGSFTFNSKVFPDPKKMIDDLHDEHFHIVLHLTRPPEHLHGRVTDSGTSAEAFSDAAHYWSTHLDTLRLGVDGWWPDEGDPLNAEARLIRNRMYWEGSKKEAPDKRPFALHRNCYAGVQRYGWLWSGDVDCTWKTLQAQIPVGLNTGLSGIPYWGTDTGGFVTTKELTGELYVRWFQFSAFCPLFRSHGRTWKTRLPWGWNTGDYGPKEVDESRLPDLQELHNAQVEPICQKYLNIRYRLLPYMYSAVHETRQTGMPLMRALWLHYSHDAKASAISDQYLWGRDLLVAPVTERGATSRRVYLPAGIWYDFWKGERVEGGNDLDRAVDLETMPVFVRAGAVIALAPVRQYVTEPVDQPIVLRVHPGADGESFLYADDGESFAYEHGDFMQLSLKWNDAARQLTMSASQQSAKVWPGYDKFQLELPHGGLSKSIEFKGNPVTVQL